MVMNIYHAAGGWQYWYDRSTRCWWAAQFDGDGYQQGDAEHAYTRAEIEELIAVTARDEVPAVRKVTGNRLHW